MLHVLPTETSAMAFTNAMDLFATEQLRGTRWELAKLAAFACFGIACCLLGASLMLSQPNTGGTGRAASPHAATPTR
jgi:hypothetical protein